jgi:hypothetical protein
MNVTLEKQTLTVALATARFVGRMYRVQGLDGDTLYFEIKLQNPKISSPKEEIQQKSCIIFLMVIGL